MSAKLGVSPCNYVVLFIVCCQTVDYTICFSFHLQFENGLREIGPRKDRNAAALRDGKCRETIFAKI